MPTGLHSPLSHPSLQSSLSNPNLQASLSSPQPQLQGSHSHPSLPASSLARHALPSTSLGHPSLSAPALSSSASSSPAPSPALAAAPYPASAPGAPPRHRRVPLSPLSLPAGPADARRSQQQLPKQFSPTMSPTLSSITQVCVAAFPNVCLPLLPSSAEFCPSHPAFFQYLFSFTPGVTRPHPLHPLPALLGSILFPLGFKNANPGVQLSNFKSWPHLLASVSFNVYLTPVSLSILICKARPAM